MSLQGSLDTFAIPDVLRLLASTKKTGQLTLTGDRGTGHVWIENGDIVGSEASASPWASNNNEVVFELLRYSEGDFIFQTNVKQENETVQRTEKVEPVINSANGMLKEWTDIVQVIPSLASPLSLAKKLPEVSVEINEASWSMIVGIGSGTTVGELGNELEQGEIVISRNLKKLVEAKLVEIEHAEPVLPDGYIVNAPESKPSVTFNRTEESNVEESRPVPTTEPVDIAPPVEITIPETEEYGSSFSSNEVKSFNISSYVNEPKIDLDDEEQIAAVIEGLQPEIIREVTKAVRAESDEERESTILALSESVSETEMDAILRFVYSLVE